MMQNNLKSPPSPVKIIFSLTELREAYSLKDVKICTTKLWTHLSCTLETRCLLNVASDLCLF